MQVLDDRQGALLPHGPTHVQLTVGAQGQLRLRVGDVATDVAVGVGYRQNGTQGAAALDLEGQAGTVALQGVAHHGGPGQCPAQGGGGHRQGLVDLPGPLRQVPAADSGGLHQAVGCNGPQNMIAHENDLTL